MSTGLKPGDRVRVREISHVDDYYWNHEGVVFEIGNTVGVRLWGLNEKGWFSADSLEKLS
jgi:hypothetical protein